MGKDNQKSGVMRPGRGVQDVKLENVMGISVFKIEQEKQNYVKGPETGQT